MARRSIRDITPETLGFLPESCSDCGYWESVEPTSLHNGSPQSFDKSDWYRTVCDRWGCCGKVVIQDDETLAYCQYAPVSWFPQARHFNLGRVSRDAVFLGCLYVDPRYRGRGLGKLLLVAMQKDLVKRGCRAVETFSRRAPARNPSGWTEFYTANGWQIIKRSGSLSLLRVDLRSTVQWQANLDSVLNRLVLAPIKDARSAHSSLNLNQ